MNVKTLPALILAFFCTACAQNAALEGAHTACAGVSRPLPEGATPPVEVTRVQPRPGPHAPYPSAKACLEVQVETDGSVTFLRTVSTTSTAFAEVFRQAVVQWRYQPATLHGEPIPVILTISAGFEHH
jgi:Gram-negative bacterial TonB protein C-terminal